MHGRSSLLQKQHWAELLVPVPLQILLDGMPGCMDAPTIGCCQSIATYDREVLVC